MQGYIRHEQNPVPGTLGNKVQSGDFLIYGEPATLEEAKRECQAEDYQLVIIDSPAKLHEVEEALMKDSNYNTISDKFWTGGYLNLSSIGKIASRDFEWHDGSSKKITTHSTELFKQFSSAQLDTAIENRVESFNKFCNYQVRDCAKLGNLLYVGLLHPKTHQGTSSRGLTILNPYGAYLNQDDDYFYVMCERKKKYHQQ